MFQSAEIKLSRVANQHMHSFKFECCAGFMFAFLLRYGRDPSNVGDDLQVHVRYEDVKTEKETSPSCKLSYKASNSP